MDESELVYHYIEPPTMVPWKSEAELDACLTAKLGIPERFLTPEESSYASAKLLEENWRRFFMPWTFRR